MLKVFDERIIMKDKQGYASVDSTVEVLDEMLNTHNIPHAFIIPTNADIDANPEATLALCYESNLHMEVSLIYALFCKLYRGLENEKIANALLKVASNYIEA